MVIAYFTASIVGKKQYQTNYQAIITHLENHGIQVISDHILETDEKSIKLQSKEERIAFHRDLERWIASCDFMVVEGTFPSISVGYEISMALHRGKTVLLLYCDGDPPTLLEDYESEKLVCEKYTPESLTSILDDFITFAKGGADQRFTFFMTAKLMTYLEKRARDSKVPKSVYLRSLLEKDMKEGI